jgi:hypothetical protein
MLHDPGTGWRLLPIQEWAGCIHIRIFHIAQAELMYRYCDEFYCHTIDDLDLGRPIQSFSIALVHLICVGYSHVLF